MIFLPFFSHRDYAERLVYPDTGYVGIGAELAQKDKPVSYASVILNVAEKNYSVTERRCLATIWALHKFPRILK